MVCISKHFYKRPNSQYPSIVHNVHMVMSNVHSQPCCTPFMARFFNNAAHSNGNTGLAVNRRLGEGHTIIGCSTYTPLVDPSDKRSEYQPIYFDTFHGRMKKMLCYGEALQE